MGVAAWSEQIRSLAVVHLWPDSEDRSRMAVDRGLGEALTAARRPGQPVEGHDRKSES